MHRIEADSRHSSIDIITSRAVARREFGNWSMQVKRAQPGVCSREFLRSVRDNAAPIGDPALRAMFIGFAFLGCDFAKQD